MFDTIDERVAHLGAPLAAWAQQDLHDRPDALLPDDVVALLRFASMVQAEALRRLAATDRAGEAAFLGGGSTTAWLREAARVDHSEARRLVTTARVLAGRLPQTAATLAEGDITIGHASTLARVVTVDRAEQADARYPGGMAGAERDLLDVAVLGTPTQTYRAASVWLHALDPGVLGLTTQQQQHARELFVSPTLNGMVDVRGRLDAETGATVLAALDAGATRDGVDDDRSPGQRRADALAAVCRQALDSGRSAAGPLPDRGGERPHLLVCVDHATLTRQPGHRPATLPGVGHLPAPAARRIACDASVSRILTGPRGETLDVGRATRTVPAALRRALVARDLGCVHPGCSRPPADCDAHHLHHWADGGATTLDNLALVCPFHHRQLHEGRRTLHRLSPAGRMTGDWRPALWVTRPYRPPSDAPPPLPLRTPPDLFDSPHDRVGPSPVPWQPEPIVCSAGDTRLDQLPDPVEPYGEPFPAGP